MKCSWRFRSHIRGNCSRTTRIHQVSFYIICSYRNLHIWLQMSGIYWESEQWKYREDKWHHARLPYNNSHWTVTYVHENTHQHERYCWSIRVEFDIVPISPLYLDMRWSEVHWRLVVATVFWIWWRWQKKTTPNDWILPYWYSPHLVWFKWFDVKIKQMQYNINQSNLKLFNCSDLRTLLYEHRNHEADLRSTSNWLSKIVNKLIGDEG